MGLKRYYYPNINPRHEKPDIEKLNNRNLKSNLKINI